MQNNSNKLTNQQLLLASNSDYPRIKHEVIAFFMNRFQELGIHFQNRFEHQLLNNKQFKITRGENYKLMPYVVLDYPQISDANFRILLRTMFWWGHYISLSLYIHKSLFSQCLPSGQLMPLETYLLTDSDIWNQQINKNSYAMITSTDELVTAAAKCDYLKLSTILPIEQYEQLNEKIAIYNKWLNLLMPQETF